VRVGGPGSGSAGCGAHDSSGRRWLPKTPAPAIWVVLVITDDGSWKTKRIKNTPRVTIAKSGSLGKPKSDDVEGVARVLPKSETRRVYNAVLKRYWYHAPWFYVHSIVRGGIDKVHVGLEITPPVG